MSIFLHIKGFTSKHKIVTALLCIVLAFTLFFTVKGWIETPTDLGAKLKYIGQQQVGCLPPPFSFECPTGGYNDYYFATDMNSGELKSYFKEAHYVPWESAIAEDYANHNFEFITTTGNTYFDLDFYQNTPANESSLGLPATTERYIVVITDSSYSVAKQSL